MRWPLLCPFMRWVCGALFLLALAAHTNQAAAQPDDDSDDDDVNVESASSIVDDDESVRPIVEL